MSHHPGVPILLQGKKKKTVGWVSSSSFTREFYSTLLLVPSRAPSTQLLFLGIQRKNTGSNMGSKINKGRLAEFWDKTSLARGPFVSMGVNDQFP